MSNIIRITTEELAKNGFTNENLHLGYEINPDIIDYLLSHDLNPDTAEFHAYGLDASTFEVPSFARGIA